MTLRNISYPLFVGAALALAPLSHGAGLLERLGLGRSTSTNAPAAAGIGSVLTHEQMVGGLKEALTDKAGGGFGGLGGLGAGLLGMEAPDLDDYVTRKTLDGLFLKIAEQEKMIRENPVARTTDLLKKVFGAVGK